MLLAPLDSELRAEGQSVSLLLGAEAGLSATCLSTFCLEKGWIETEQESVMSWEGRGDIGEPQLFPCKGLRRLDHTFAALRCGIYKMPAVADH